MAVSKRLRYEILRRDDHTCRYCGATAPGAPLRVDHVTPVALGGADTPDNLVTSCEPCNSGKSSATVDAAVVAGVSDDALRWAEAMKQAAAELSEQAKPKDDYRNAFEAEWNTWTYPSGGKRLKHDLPADWKSSIERFRQAGLPIEVWADIVERAMTNKTVRADNLFRYCCGIAWRMISELHDRAKSIAGGAPQPKPVLDSLVQAAIDVWAADMGDEADEAMRQSILASAQAYRELDSEPHRLVEAAQYAAWFGLPSIDDAVAALEHDSIMRKWQSAWRTSVGDYANAEQISQVKKRIVDLLAADVYVGRLEKAAVYAGAHRSTFLHFGLTRDELACVGGSEVGAKALETWSESFHAAIDRWPNSEERLLFVESFRRIVREGDLWITDVYAASAAAGAYQDPDFSTCMPRCDSVFEAARALPQPSA
ncbi:HNH endonuclease [Streptomyces sp. NPDC024089]|uniref:HNH endonuclease n=1 Tax=Streptomyces sp. NPDC024089 TaxID=3154328 RepID=UPI0033FAB14F